MIRALVLNPFVAVHLAALVQTVLVACLLVVPDGYMPAHEGQRRALAIGRWVGSGLLVLFGVLILDAALPWLAGAWTRTDWRYQVPGVLLLLFLGVEYVVVGVFRRGALVDLVYLAGAAVALPVFVHGVVSREAVMGPHMEGGLPVLLAVLVAGVLAIAGLKVAWASRPAAKSKRGDKPVDETLPKWLGGYWDASGALRRVFNRPANYIAWLLVTAQSMLSFFGYSLLSFVPA